MFAANGIMKRLDWTCGGLAEGLRCYRAGQFFAAHKHWQAVWLELPDPEKTFLQALIQVAAAFHHFQRGNQEGTFLLAAGGATATRSSFTFLRQIIDSSALPRNSRVVEGTGNGRY